MPLDQGVDHRLPHRLDRQHRAGKHRDQHRKAERNPPRPAASAAQPLPALEAAKEFVHPLPEGRGGAERLVHLPQAGQRRLFPRLGLGHHQGDHRVGRDADPLFGCLYDGSSSNRFLVRADCAGWSLPGRGEAVGTFS